MERAEAKRVRQQIIQLEERHCQSCQKVKKWKKELGSFKGSQLCYKKCRVGKQIRALGDQIVYGRPTIKARELTKEMYLSHKMAGLTDLEICAKYKVGKQMMADRKSHWGLNFQPPSKERYLQLKAEGVSDDFAAELMDVSLPTLRRYIKQWGADTLPHVNIVKYTSSGEEITPELYKREVERLGYDWKVAEKWGVSKSTMQRRKRSWREKGMI